MLNSDENISTPEELANFVTSGRYKPAERSEDVFLITTLLVLLNSKPIMIEQGTVQSKVNVAQLPIFNKIVKDIRNYVLRVHHFDKNFVTIGFLFCKEVMPYVEPELMQGLIKRTVENFEVMSPDQISYACLTSFLLHDQYSKNRQIKQELFRKLEEYLEINHNSLTQGLSRKSA